MKKVGATLAVTALTVAPLFAQGTEVAKKTLLHKYLIDGGPLTWVIVTIGMLSVLGLIVFNSINLGKSKFNPDDLRAALYDHMLNCRVRSAIELAASHPSYLGRMLAFSLPNVDATQPETLGREAVEDAMADFSVNEGRKQMLWVNLISLIAQAAPMMGLFGTVVGMVETFATLAANNKADPALLAKDISVALLTTLWGLVIALMAVGAYFLFKNRYNALVAACNESAEELINASIQTVNGDAQLAKIPEGLAV
jgi:biopolymer transport protein ExbB